MSLIDPDLIPNALVEQYTEALRQAVLAEHMPDEVRPDAVIFAALNLICTMIDVGWEPEEHEAVRAGWVLVLAEVLGLQTHLVPVNKVAEN